ncbi:hypothetical protein MHU86_10335 [Fragilaria crotonensis]|nr:hypothetical protein MHU86_10335 [Fragilaria crotonensis]
MLKLGFRYETRRKGYYVDGHERKATVQYRWDFCDRYLSLERRMFRWIQVSLEEAEKLQALGKVTKGSGYKYTDELTGKAMVEYHVDTCRGFMDCMNEQTSIFGGNLSVRMNPDERPVISFGQDECIVKQYYSFTNKSWTGPNREQALIPKDDGLGVMMSDLLHNARRCAASRWNEQGIRGEQNIMRDSIIKGEDGYLGPHNRSLNVGDVQSMVFRSTDNGPYWMTPEEQEQTRKDHFVTTVTTKEHTKPQLIELLRQRGIENAKEVRNISGTWQNAQASHSLTRNKMCFKAGKEKQRDGADSLGAWMD